jgi:putative Mg2+ transporter-C (MgtC) family protein
VNSHPACFFFTLSSVHLVTLSLISNWDLTVRAWASGLGWPMEGMLRLVLAALAGGLVGLEREVRGRQAGFRTNLLVCLGSALVMIVSIEFSHVDWGSHPGFNVNIDPARIAYGVMTGVGFLGAGTILQHKGEVRGLTTAAAMWCVAAIGLAVGFGMYVMAAFATFLVVMALWFLDYFENFLPKARYRTIVVRTQYRPSSTSEIVTKFKRPGLDIVDVTLERDEQDLTHANIQIHMVYMDKTAFHNLVHEIETSDRYQLISTRET